MISSIPSRKRSLRRVTSFNFFSLMVTSVCSPGNGLVAPTKPGIFPSRVTGVKMMKVKKPPVGTRTSRPGGQSTTSSTSRPHSNRRERGGRAFHVRDLGALPGDWKEFGQWAKSHTNATRQRTRGLHKTKPIDGADGRSTDDYEATSFDHFNLTKTSSARLSLHDGDKAPHFHTLTRSSKSRPTPASEQMPTSTSSRSNEWTGQWGVWREPGEAQKEKSEVNRKAKDTTKNRKTVTRKNASGSKPSVRLPAHKDPSAPLTLSDLEFILNDNGYVRQSDLDSNHGYSITDDSSGRRNMSRDKPSSSGGKTAFPQPSVLSYRDVRIGTTLVSAFCGFVLSVSVIRNLWLVGLVVGALYGHSVAEDGVTDPDLGPVAELLINYGRKAAKKYLQLFDFYQGVVFMYKTGQLSYAYWKQYETLDRRFGIQDKMDAWNARFVQGKKDFDEWERENEIGRKVLAALRTVWMVEEQRLVEMSLVESS